MNINAGLAFVGEYSMVYLTQRSSDQRHCGALKYLKSARPRSAADENFSPETDLKAALNGCKPFKSLHLQPPAGRAHIPLVLRPNERSHSCFVRNSVSLSAVSVKELTRKMRINQFHRSGDNAAPRKLDNSMAQLRSHLFLSMIVR
jgi:hypothetical protein